MDTLRQHLGCWLILMKDACSTKGHIYSHICPVNQTTGDESPSISLYPTLQSSALSLLSVNDVYSCACGGGPLLWTAAIAHDSAGPQAGTQLAGQTSRHLLGVDWAMALKSPAACTDLLPDTSRFFSSAPLPPTRSLFYRLIAGLIRADMLNVLQWAEVASAGVCICVGGVTV